MLDNCLSNYTVFLISCLVILIVPVQLYVTFCRNKQYPSIHPPTQTTKFHAHEIKLFHRQFVSALFNKHITRKTNISEKESIENSLTQLGLGEMA